MSVAPGDRGPAWIELSVPDPESLAAFYGWLFGWKTGDGQLPDGATGLYDESGRLVLLLRRGQGEGAWIPVFQVPDPAAASARAVELGATPHRDTSVADWHARILRDPAGALFGIGGPAGGAGAELGLPERLLVCELGTRDLVGAADFYREVLGVRALGLRPDPFDYHLLVRGGAALASILDMTSFHDASTPQHWVAYVDVADVSWASARAAELGALVRVPRADSPFGEYAVLEDPDGLLFGLGTRPPPERLAGMRLQDLAGGPPTDIGEVLAIEP